MGEGTTQNAKGKPQHSTAGLKEAAFRCHHGYLGSKVLTYGEGYLGMLAGATGAGRWPVPARVVAI